MKLPMPKFVAPKMPVPKIKMPVIKAPALKMPDFESSGAHVTYRFSRGSVRAFFASLTTLGLSLYFAGMMTAMTMLRPVDLARSGDGKGGAGDKAKSVPEVKPVEVAPPREKSLFDEEVGGSPARLSWWDSTPTGTVAQALPLPEAAGMYPEGTLAPLTPEPMPQPSAPVAASTLASAVPSAADQENATGVSVQVGAFRSVENADALARRLRSMGYEPEVVQARDSEARLLHLVQLTGLSSERAAETLVADLRSKRVPAMVVASR